MNILLTILSFAIMVAILIAILMVCNNYIFPKIRINKYIPLGISVAGLVFQFACKLTNGWLSAGITIVVVTFFAWYLYLSQNGTPKKEKKIVMKPKAKPNRVKDKK